MDDEYTYFLPLRCELIITSILSISYVLALMSRGCKLKAITLIGLFLRHVSQTAIRLRLFPRFAWSCYQNRLFISTRIIPQLIRACFPDGIDYDPEKGY